MYLNIPSLPTAHRRAWLGWLRFYYRYTVFTLGDRGAFTFTGSSKLSFGCHQVPVESVFWLCFIELCSSEFFFFAA
jgi:hypothetical protein